MNRILVTGATGHIGSEVINFLYRLDYAQIIAACRNIEVAKSRFSKLEKLSYCQFDFEKTETFTNVFKDIDLLFLLRPPHIADIKNCFLPLLKSAKNSGIENIVFLSVQGVEKSKMIPHHKIEKLIVSLGFNYIFIRPSYFMQNLSSTLLTEIKETHQITLPSGNAEFNWIDAQNIGEVGATLLMKFDEYKNSAFDITGTENLNFKEVTRLMSELFLNNYSYKSLGPFKFYFKKKKEGLKHDYALVLTLLHFLPRFQKAPTISTHFQNIMGKQPNTLKEFLIRHESIFLN